MSSEPIRMPLRLSPAALVLCSFLLLTNSGQAMEIQQFDKMNIDDQSKYVADLIIGAEKVLKDSGQADKANQVDKLFSEVKPGDATAIGMVEFEVNLARARLADARRLERDPNVKRLEVEDAMAVTLKKSGIEIPNSFFSVNSDFRPRHPANH